MDTARRSREEAPDRNGLDESIARAIGPRWMAATVFGPRTRAPRRVVIRLILMLAVAFPGATSTSHAQGRPPHHAEALATSIPNLPIRRTIVAAEQEGASFPRTASFDSQRAPLLTVYAGSPNRTCGRAEDGTTTGEASARISKALRTGDFAIGAQIVSARAGRPAKVWWSPLHDPSIRASGLLVRAARIDADATPADTMRFIKLSYGWTMGEPPHAFFPSTIILPSPGRWLVIATSGDDWGCMIMPVAG